MKRFNNGLTGPEKVGYPTIPPRWEVVVFLL
jgi:hypothetical protein